MKKLILKSKEDKDLREYGLLAVKSIRGDNKNIFVEEKVKGFIVLIGEGIASNLDSFEGFRIVRKKEEIFIELLGLSVFLKLEKATKLNVNKRIFFIENLSENDYRLTFSNVFYDKIDEIEKIFIKKN